MTTKNTPSLRQLRKSYRMHAGPSVATPVDGRSEAHKQLRMRADAEYRGTWDDLPKGRRGAVVALDECELVKVLGLLDLADDENRIL